MTHPSDRSARFDARTTQAYHEAQLPELFAVRADAAQSELLLYDEIGEYGIRAKDLVTALAKVPAKSRLTVRINSPGGSAFDGLAMYSALRTHPGGVDTVVDGLAASAASVIAMAGDNIAMHATSSLMIHNSHGLVIGNKADMNAMSGQLEVMDGKMAAIYADKTGLAPADVAALMDRETWFTSTSAVEQGFADTVIEPPQRAKRAGASAEFEILASADTPERARTQLRAAYDPDGDGDDDVAEAIALITDAIGSCADAIEALEGDEPPEDATDPSGGMLDLAAVDQIIADYQHHSLELRRRRLRLASLSN